jgi:hypothetical protein
MSAPGQITVSVNSLLADRPFYAVWADSYATIALSSGESLLYVAGQLGHADLKMLERRYARWKPSKLGPQGGRAVVEANRELWGRLAMLTESAPEPQQDLSEPPCNNDATIMDFDS